MIVRMTMACCLALILGCESSRDEETPLVPDSPFGHFEGEVSGVWESAPVKLTLNQDFVYVSPTEKRWLAKDGSVVNGASIPKPFWSIIGSPFVGDYFKASVVHDVACVEMTESWQTAHRMFYNACRCGGVGKAKAKLMYWAVYNFGPRWREVHEMRTEMRMKDGKKVQTSVRVSRKVRNDPIPPADEDIIKKAREYFDSNDPSLTDIESLKF